jgi:hypothetical protein
MKQLRCRDAGFDFDAVVPELTRDEKGKEDPSVFNI